MKGQAPVRIAIGALGFVAGVVPLILALRIPGGRHEVLLAAFGPLIGWAFIGTGLFAWARRPAESHRPIDDRGRVQFLRW